MSRYARLVLALAVLGLATPALGAEARPTVLRPTAFAITPPLRDLPEHPTGVGVTRRKTNFEVGEAEGEYVRPNKPPRRHYLDGIGDRPDLSLVGEAGSPQAPTPVPGLALEGISSNDSAAVLGFLVMPPDPVGDVGPNHYVQSVNLVTRVFDKSGAPVTAAFALSTLFASLGGPCFAVDDGDPITLYDPLADRWLLSQFCVGPGDTQGADFGRYFQQIAISVTSDPTGPYYAWNFTTPNTLFPDYPKVGVWPDAYYMTVNQFSWFDFHGAGFYAFDRARMLAGDPDASLIYFDRPNSGGAMPPDLDGLMPPPPGTPAVILEFCADEFVECTPSPGDALLPYEIVPNFDDPDSSTITPLAAIPLTPFDGRAPSARNVIEQPAPATATQRLDPIPLTLMHRLAYRNLGTQAAPVHSYVGNFVVNVSGVNPTNSNTHQAAPRWFELRRDPVTGAMSALHNATFSPDPGVPTTGGNRWNASAAQDHQGNLALTYSLSSTTIFPGIYLAGRLAADPANTLGPESSLHVANGVQQTTNGRWGDYSALSVDPVDDCTFWYTNEYRNSTFNGTGSSNAFRWTTRFGSFRFSECDPAPRAALEVQVSVCGTGAPISGATVAAVHGFLRHTDATGAADFDLMPAGTYDVIASAFGYSTATQAGVVLANGSTTQVALCLQPAPELATSSSTALLAESCTPGNGTLDPGESAQVSFCVENLGLANTVNLIGTLQASAGVLPITVAQNYGVVVAGGPAVCRNFLFTVDPTLPCGTPVSVTIALQDGATSHGTATAPFAASPPTLLVFSENFDSVTAGTLPAGWTQQNVVGTGAVWQATGASNPTPGFFSTPHSARIDNPASVSDKRLTSPAIFVPAAGGRLSFRNRFNTELGADGGTLEIAIGGGPFVDILAAGGAFVQRGYVQTLALSFASPIAGRQAWTGNGPTLDGSSYWLTIVDLPAATAGQSIQLRWRFGSDNAVSGQGWRIDDVELRVPECASTCALPCSLSQPGNVTVGNDAGLCSAAVTYSLPVASGFCPGAAVSCVPPSGSVFPVGSTPVICDAGGDLGLAVTFQVQVQDVQLPTVSAPNPVVPNTPGLCSATVAFSPTAVDNCPGVTASCAPPSGSPFPVGVTPILCTATDAAGNTAQAPGTVTVQDVEPPSITAPNPVVGNDPGLCSAAVPLAPVTADNCPGVTASCTPPSGSTFPVGVTPIVCTATDGAGNATPGGGSVTVQDLEAPLISCPASISLALPPGAAGLVVNFPPPVVSDNCSAVASCAPPSGSEFLAGQTTVACTATDAAQNAAICAFEVSLGLQSIQEIPTLSGRGTAGLALLLAALSVGWIWRLRRRAGGGAA